MDYFSRVRRIRTTPVQENSTEQIFSNDLMQTGSPTFVRRPDIKFVSGDPTSSNGIKTINKSRKVYKLNSNKSNCSTTSSDSCNASITTSRNPPSLHNDTSPHVPRKIPVHKTDSNGSTANDSGIDSSGKRKVAQTDSNSSTGSVMSGPVNLQSELERRCHEAARLAYKEEAREAKQLLKQRNHFREGILNSEGIPNLVDETTDKTTEKNCEGDSNLKGEPRQEKVDKNVESMSRSISVKNFKKKKKKLKNDGNVDPIESDCSESDAEVENAPDRIPIKKPASTQDDQFADDEHDASGTDDFDSGHTSPNSNSEKELTSSTSSSDRSRTSADNDTEELEAPPAETTNEKKLDKIDQVEPTEVVKEQVKNAEKTISADGPKVKTNYIKVDVKNVKNSAKKTSQRPPIMINGAPVKPENYAQPSKIGGTLPPHGLMKSLVPSLQQRVVPTCRRVAGVTLRDLYSLRAVLSDSDNGTVFSGRRRIDNAAVAIKRIMKSKVKRWHAIKDKSVPMEIALLRKVNETRHPGVVTLLEWFECSDCFLLVMARPTPVLDLFDFVSERKRLDETTSKMIFTQVLEAMYHCHQRAVLHRDIKLENILVKTDTLISTIIDFGCGTHLNLDLYKDFAGTPQYYPPEYYICKQYHGLPAAVWSCGVMLYAMLCGRLPFASAHEIVHLEPSWHGGFCRKISPCAKDLVEHMLKKQPRRRMHINDVLKHKWLKNLRYNALNGEITIFSDDEKSTIIATSQSIMSQLERAKNAASNPVF